MKTEDMFKEEGMILANPKDYYEENNIIAYIDEDANFCGVRRKITFYIKDKVIYNSLYQEDNLLDGSCPITTSLLKCINKQVEELGWNNEER